MRNSRVVFGFALVWLSATTVFAHPSEGERYFLVIFGTGESPFRTHATHTWATFVKTAETGTGAKDVHSDAISWMPANLQIRSWSMRPEPGVNLTVEQTMAWTRVVGARTSMLGPYEIDREHYDRLLARKKELESGAIAYRAVGGLTRQARVSNCGQSFTRADPVVGSRYLHPTPVPGEQGATLLAARYVRAGTFIQPEVTHDWLLPILGIEKGMVIRREPGERVDRVFGSAFFAGPSDTWGLQPNP